MKNEDWETVNELERKWWGDCTNTADEEAKQQYYVHYMGLDQYKMPGILGGNYDMRGESVLDVGGGPVSILLKMRNRGYSVVVDPCKYPQWILDRYKAAGIEFVNMKFEDFHTDEKFDNVLIYNVCQHVQDPEKVLQIAKRYGKLIRIFEWVDTEVNESHPFSNTKAFYDKNLETYGKTVQLTWAGRSTPLAYYAVADMMPEPEDLKFRFHLLGLAHLPTRKEISACFSDDTEIMTEDGWKSLKRLCELNSKIKVATLNPKTDEVEYCYPNEWIILNYKGKMFHEKGCAVDFMVTPEHNLWASTRTAVIKDGKKYRHSPFKFIQAFDAKKQMRYRRNFPWKDVENEQYFILPEYKSEDRNLTCFNRTNRFGKTYFVKSQVRKYKSRNARKFLMDDWLRLLGIYLAEGWIHTISYKRNGEKVKCYGSVCIAQEKKANIPIISGWLDKLKLNYVYNGKAFSISDVQLASWFKKFGKAKDKYIPKEFKNLSKRQLVLLLEALILGDGWTQKDLKAYSSISKQLIDDVSEIALKLGYVTTMSAGQDKKGTWGYALSMGGMKRAFPEVGPSYSQSGTQYYNPKYGRGHNWVDYDGKVYCLNVKNHIVYIRRNGKSCWQGQCAYTQKVYKLAQMLRSLGHHVIFYGVEHSEWDKCGDEHYQVLTDAERRACYGDYDWKKEFFKHDGKDAAYTTFARNAIDIINKIKQPRDFLLVPLGNYQQSISDKTGVLTVESGIGYIGVFSKYRIFESYTWMHYIYGFLKQQNGSWYDAVIPNYFDPEDFPLCEEKEDYFLYIGRIIKRKGVEIASQVASYLGKRLVIVGQGDLKSSVEGIDLTREKHIDYIGAIGPEERKKVMGKAILTFVPTYYIEPFGGVAVESMMCGTPVLTTDWGVFSETVQHGTTGFRCRTFDDFVWAAKNISSISPKNCHNWAVQNYSMDRVKWMYNEFFQKVYDLNEYEGWYKIHKNRKNLDWLKKFPVD